MGFWMKTIMCNQHNRMLQEKTDMVHRQVLYEKETNKYQRSMVSLLVFPHQLFPLI
jgi:tRNA threonylcarbamoyladenosine modification (KEOPS) complex  Pcc1 subunit